MNNVILRSLSGAVYVAVITGAVLAGCPYFGILMLALALTGILEFTKVANTYPTIGKATTAVDTVGACALACLPVQWAATALTAYIMVRFTMALYDKRDHAYRAAAKSLTGVIYVGWGLCMLNNLYVLSGKWTVLVMFIMIWLNDTGAFCFGSLLGKHRLFPRLSPKKSWEGFWGGMLCCVVCGAVCYLCFDNLLGVGPVWSVVTGVVVSVMSTWGDLFESMLKRTMGVKDSGNIIPGHGGILDRIDSLLFVAPSLVVLHMLLQLL